MMELIPNPAWHVSLASTGTFAHIICAILSLFFLKFVFWFEIRIYIVCTLLKQWQVNNGVDNSKMFCNKMIDLFRESKRYFLSCLCFCMWAMYSSWNFSAIWFSSSSLLLTIVFRFASFFLVSGKELIQAFLFFNFSSPLIDFC